MEPDEALVGVEVAGPVREGAAASAGGLGVQPQQQCIECRVVAGGRGYLVDLGEAGVGDGATGRGQPSGFGDFAGRIVAGREVTVVLGVAVEAA